MTPALHALGIYTGLLVLIGIWLISNVGKMKSSEGVSIGDGGSPKIIRAMRGQMNFVENVPLVLISLLIGVLIGWPVWAIHAAGILLVVGRFLHAYHFIQEDAPGWQRAGGFICTFLVLVGSALGLIGCGIYALFFV